LQVGAFSLFASHSKQLPATYSQVTQYSAQLIGLADPKAVSTTVADTASGGAS
jgi:hypothetical protein